MKKALLILLLIPYSFCLYGQNRKIDSLRTALKTEQDDTNKVNTLNALCEVLWRTGNYDSAMTNAMHSKDIAEKIAASPDAIIAKTGKNGLAGAYRVIGIVYRHHGNFPKALENELKALALCEETGNIEGIGTNTGNIGIIYWNMTNYDKALEYYLKALDINTKAGNKSHMAANIGNIGIIYRLKGDLKKALEYDYKAIDIQKQTGDEDGIATNLGNIGLIYMYQGKYDTSLVYYFKALAILRKSSGKGGMAINLGNIGHSYTYMQKFVLAKMYFDSAMAISKSIKEKEEIKNIYEYLCDYDSAMGNYKAEIDDYKRFILYRDSLVNEANTKKTVQAEMNYDFEQKQAAEKAEQDKKDAIAEQDRKKQVIIRNAFMGGFLLMIALAFFIFRGYRQKQKANAIILEQKKEVEQQKAIVEEKNKDITDSIRYASRIQHALLTTDEYIGQHLKEYFILFKPRDIVSGDFYWAFQAEGRFYLACCDCTGHGVPGAFMSLLNISMLNESVVERKATRPDLILNAIRDSVIKALNPDGKAETKDGMDCSLIAFDFERSIFHTACANNPVWVISSPLAERKLTEIEPDKMPVGIQHGAEKPFTLHSVNVKKGDCVYAFTDGFADQFGGDKGKKFKYKQLQELLIANAHKRMSTQKEILNKAFEEWKGALEQVDDVLIIGIRI